MWTWNLGEFVALIVAVQLVTLGLVGTVAIAYVRAKARRLARMFEREHPLDLTGQGPILDELEAAHEQNAEQTLRDLREIGFKDRL